MIMTVMITRISGGWQVLIRWNNGDTEELRVDLTNAETYAAALTWAMNDTPGAFIGD
jgi:hypothetical protein